MVKIHSIDCYDSEDNPLILTDKELWEENGTIHIDFIMVLGDSALPDIHVTTAEDFALFLQEKGFLHWVTDETNLQGEHILCEGAIDSLEDLFMMLDKEERDSIFKKYLKYREII